jgi:hypothetical protein
VRLAVEHDVEAVSSSSSGGVWRIPLVYFEEFRFEPSGFVHASCAREYFETTDLIERIKYFNPNLNAGDLDDLKLALATTTERSRE